MTVWFDFPATLVGRTPHVRVWATQSLGDGANGLARTLLKGGLIEVFYGRVADAYRTPAASRRLVDLIISPATYSAGYHYAGGTAVYYGAALFSPVTRYLWSYATAIFVAELVEMFSEWHSPNLHWSDDADQGEAMSRFLAESFVTGAPNFSTVPQWWISGAGDFVSHPSSVYLATGSTVAVGCCVSMLHYLKTALRYPIDAIVAAGDVSPQPTMEAVFRKLTGRSNGYAEMMAAIHKRLPAGSRVWSGTENDNLFDAKGAGATP